MSLSDVILIYYRYFQGEQNAGGKRKVIPPRFQGIAGSCSSTFTFAGWLNWYLFLQCHWVTTAQDVGV